MRVITWNIHRASQQSPVWKLLSELKPDIVLLQEVGSIPEEIKKIYKILSRVAITKAVTPQKFSTAILVKGNIIKEVTLKSKYDWVNKELEFFKGNFISCAVHLQNQEPVNIVSVYSPAWPVSKKRLKGIDVTPVKLSLNPDVWGSEIIWSALKNTISNNEAWIAGGDYNISETFDINWQDINKVRYGIRCYGSMEMLERMNHLGFTECLRGYYGKIVPTFKHSSGKINHQIDHLFVTNSLYSQIQTCTVGDQSIIFGNSLSDHLPVIADFKEVEKFGIK